VVLGVRDLSERHGRVVDASGAAVPDALIAIIARSVPIPEIALRTDAEGRFMLRLPPGRFTLRAHSPDGGTGEAEIVEPSTVEDIVITIGR